MLNILKKDCKIIRTMLILVLIITCILPALMSYLGDGVVVPAGILLSMISSLLGGMIISAIYEEEEKYPKASALLTTIGYSRKAQVISKFALLGILWIYIQSVYWIESMFISGIAKPSLVDFLFSLFIFSFVLGGYIALVTRFGIQVGRLIMVFIILLISVGPGILSKLSLEINFHFLESLKGGKFYVLMGGFTLLYVLLCMKLSVRRYQKKEL